MDATVGQRPASRLWWRGELAPLRPALAARGRTGRGGSNCTEKVRHHRRPGRRGSRAGGTSTRFEVAGGGAFTTQKCAEIVLAATVAQYSPYRPPLRTRATITKSKHISTTQYKQAGAARHRFVANICTVLVMRVWHCLQPSGMGLWRLTTGAGGAISQIPAPATQILTTAANCRAKSTSSEIETKTTPERRALRHDTPAQTL